jgi:hypothetical protein
MSPSVAAVMEHSLARIRHNILTDVNIIDKIDLPVNLLNTNKK